MNTTAKPSGPTHPRTYEPFVCLNSENGSNHTYIGERNGSHLCSCGGRFVREAIAQAVANGRSIAGQVVAVVPPTVSDTERQLVGALQVMTYHLSNRGMAGHPDTLRAKQIIAQVEGRSM